MLNKINLARADLNLLTLFEVILRERHVGRAAIQLNLTSSAVSHGLGRLRRLLNDPLFLRTPKGVVPTARAVALAEPVADLLAQARNVLASAAPFDPATSTRRFVIGAPDGSVFLKPLLAMLRQPRARHRYRAATVAAAAGRPLRRAGVDAGVRRTGGRVDRYRGRADRSRAAALRGPHHL